ncbi:DNA-binding protein [Desulfonema magnum]|uniref:Uncharacterized protein n=1 Tax=Desulfonema magnum TaxID=45655 RepID=A0A975GLX7_9BACT|nr:hypothetical protein [Desulfonema magnum]QTA86232.1 Uncharacterized protein dnm_022530 [Desulfonema magnum]
MNKISKSYQEKLLKSLTDPDEAAAYLNAALDEGSDEVFLMALENVAEAQRRVSHSETKEGRKIRLSDLSEIFAGLRIRFVAQASAPKC